MKTLCAVSNKSLSSSDGNAASWKNVIFPSLVHTHPYSA